MKSIALPPRERAGVSAIPRRRTLSGCERSSRWSAFWTIVVATLYPRSCSTDWRLVATVFVVFHGVMTIHAADRVSCVSDPPSSRDCSPLVVDGFIDCRAVFPCCPLSFRESEKAWPSMPNQIRGWRCRRANGRGSSAVIALVYLTLYFTFGYFIAWKNPAVPRVLRW